MVFCQERHVVIDELLTNPAGLVDKLWSPDSPISIDRECLCQMGKYAQDDVSARIETRADVSPILRRMYRCPQCTNIGRITDLTSSTVGQPFRLECGRDQGKPLILERMPVSILRVSLTNTPQQYLDNILKNNRQIVGCEPTLVDLNDALFIGSDKFTNRVLVNWYADYILSGMRLPHINKMHTAFICGENGYMLFDHPTLGNLEQFTAHLSHVEHHVIPGTDTEPIFKGHEEQITRLKSSVASNILKQLFTTLRVLKHYDFSHGGVTPNSLVFYDDPLHYEYDGMTVKSEYTLKIATVSSSGITVKNKHYVDPSIDPRVLGRQQAQCRLYNKSELAEAQIEAIPFKPIVNVVKIHSYPVPEGADTATSIVSRDHTVYRLSNQPGYTRHNLTFIYLQHMGIPLYQSSFNSYSYMVLLMSTQAFYGAVMEDATLYTVWRSMWLPSEFDSVSEKIKDLHGDDEITQIDIIRFLAKYSLRCDCTEMVWKLLRTLYPDGSS